MIIFWGTIFLGKVDRVPGLCYVVTRFGHIWFIPLLPLGTYLILDTPGERGKRGLPIGLSLKSLVIGWLRAACLPVAVISAALTTVGCLDIAISGHGSETVLATAPWFALSASLFASSYFFRRASRRRAVVLGAYLGIPEDVILGLLTPKVERLKKLEAYLRANPDVLASSSQIEQDRRSDQPPDTSVYQGRRE
jgi:hypothetical protein